MVTSAKMQKTIVVRVTRQVQHRLYDRYVQRVQEILRARRTGRGAAGRHGAHRGDAAVSKLKRWRLAEVVSAPHQRRLTCDRGEERHGNDSDAKLADGGR